MVNSSVDVGRTVQREAAGSQNGRLIRTIPLRHAALTGTADANIVRRNIGRSVGRAPGVVNNSCILYKMFFIPLWTRPPALCCNAVHDGNPHSR